MNREIQIALIIGLVLFVLYLIGDHFNNSYDTFVNEAEQDVKDVGEKIEHGAEDVVHFVEKGAEDVVDEIESGFNKVGDFIEGKKETNRPYDDDYNNDFDNEFGPISLKNPLADYDTKINIAQVQGEMAKSSDEGQDVHDPNTLINSKDKMAYDSVLNSQENVPPQNLMNSKRIEQIQNDNGILETDEHHGFHGYEEDLFNDFREIKGETTVVHENNDKKIETFSNDSQNARICMIWANWCGYSQTAIKDWKRLEESHNGSNINGYTVTLENYEESEHSDLIGPGKKYEVDGFPTIIIMKDGSNDQIKFNSIEYNDMITKIQSHLQ